MIRVLVNDATQIWRQKQLDTKPVLNIYDKIQFVVFPKLMVFLSNLISRKVDFRMWGGSLDCW